MSRLFWFSVGVFVASFGLLSGRWMLYGFNVHSSSLNHRLVITALASGLVLRITIGLLQKSDLKKRKLTSRF